MQKRICCRNNDPSIPVQEHIQTCNWKIIQCTVARNTSMHKEKILTDMDIMSPMTYLPLLSAHIDKYLLRERPK